MWPMQLGASTTTIDKNLQNEWQLSAVLGASRRPSSTSSASSLAGNPKRRRVPNSPVEDVDDTVIEVDSLSAPGTPSILLFGADAEKAVWDASFNGSGTRDDGARAVPTWEAAGLPENPLEILLPSQKLPGEGLVQVVAGGQEKCGRIQGGRPQLREAATL